MVQLRKRGLATVVICSEPFLELAKTQARVFGVADLPLVVIPHPLGGLSLAAVKARADVAIPQLLAVLKEQSK